MKKGYSLSNGINYSPDINPRFLQTPSTNQKNDPSLDAVSGQSSAVEESSTEASATMESSDEPRLEFPKL